MSSPSSEWVNNDAAFDVCRAVTRTHARSFFAASHLLSTLRRRAAFAVYAFCRQADDAVDAQVLDQAQVLAAVSLQSKRLDRIYAGAPRDPVETALASTVRAYAVPRVAFDDLLDGMRIDAGEVRFDTWTQLADYCHKVAGVVGHMMLPVLGAQGDEARRRAADLGVAMQLTNILRDVDEDLSRGRIYLPAEELALFGLTHGDLSRRSPDPERWHAFMTAQIRRARWYYARAQTGIPLIRTRTGRTCTRAMAAIYGDILRVLECAGSDPFRGRVRTSGLRKTWLALGAVLGRVPPVSRDEVSSVPCPEGPIPLLRPGETPADVVGRNGRLRGSIVPTLTFGREGGR